MPAGTHSAVGRSSVGPRVMAPTVRKESALADGPFGLYTAVTARVGSIRPILTLKCHGKMTPTKVGIRSGRTHRDFSRHEPCHDTLVSGSSTRQHPVRWNDLSDRSRSVRSVLAQYNCRARIFHQTLQALWCRRQSPTNVPLGSWARAEYPGRTVASTRPWLAQ